MGEAVAGDEAFARWWSPGAVSARARPTFTGYPFTLGVASGEPVSSGVVLWTRLAPEPLTGGGIGADPVAVDWEVAEDEEFGRVAQRGTAVARAAWAHSVHVEVSGLEPARVYFYRFMAGEEVSPVGRTRTAPATGEVPLRLRFGLGCCQHFESGYYAAHRHLEAEDLDLMVFVGDYIYEGPGRAGGVRRHIGGEARTLADYRNRHAQYKTDPDLQSLHAAVPWLMTWDDHEVDNNYAGTRSESLDPEFRRRRAAAYRACARTVRRRFSFRQAGVLEAAGWRVLQCARQAVVSRVRLRRLLRTTGRRLRRGSAGARCAWNASVSIMPRAATTSCRDETTYAVARFGPPALTPICGPDPTAVATPAAPANA